MSGSDPSTPTAADHHVAVAVEMVIVVGYSLLMMVAILLGMVDGPLRVLLAAPVVGFLPGYALVSALLPGHDGRSDPTLTASRLREPGVAWFERCALAFAASLALLPIVALGLSALSMPMSLDLFLVALALVIAVGMVIGLGRRASLPLDQRYALPINRWYREAKANIVDNESSLDVVLNVALALAVVIAVSGLTYGLVAPDRGESYSEVALLTEQNGSLVAGGYPETVAAGESSALTLAVENKEGGETRYSVVVLLERVRTSGDDFIILQQEELTRFSLTVADQSTANQNFSVAPEMLGEDLRLDVLVFEGSAPTDAVPKQADHRLYLWLDVRESAGTTNSTQPVGWA